MAISRRHLDGIAKAVKKHHGHELEAVRPLVEELADILATMHGGFNKPLFMLACGYASGESSDASV